MFNIVDFSKWSVYKGFSEGSGRSEKKWIESNDGKIGLFKWPKTDSEGKTNTYEHISEHLAHKIGALIEIPTAQVDIGKYEGRIGSMSYLVNEKNEELREGLWFILKLHPHYDPENLFDPDAEEYYSIKHLFEIMDHEITERFWIEMLLFDFLIGNTDRHQNNWAFLMPVEDREKTIIRIRPCPLYDNGSSLCCYVKDSEIESFLGKDYLKFNSLVDTKSKSLIRIDEKMKNRPRHSEVVKYMMQRFEYTEIVADRVLSIFSKNIIDNLINEYPDNLLSSLRKELISRYLEEKLRILKTIMSGEKK